MDAVDSSDRYDVSTAEDTPSLLTIVLDTNPRAWASLAPVLPLSRAIANVLVLVNAHLSFSNVNQVALIAAHNSRASWLYPEHHQPSSSSSSAPPPPPATAATTTTTTTTTTTGAANTDHAGDTEMAEAPPGGSGSAGAGAQKASANKYPQFAQIEAIVLRSIKRIIEETTSQDLACETTKLSGALTLALSHINKVSQSLTSSASATATTLPGSTTAATEAAAAAAQAQASTFRARILVLSVSDSEPSQYIPTMNAVFAAAHNGVAVDTLSLCGDSAFLQQASFNTGGSFITARNPQGLLSYLMFGLIADTEARASLIIPTNDTVDFRAACFCHGNVVDTGFVCSVCLSIFCELPADAECLTCGTTLSLGNYGAKPAVVPRKKKKKKRVINGVTREETGSATATPMR
ncbi:hypothetical protein N3K66_008586 [Trichothecium roseum]|uniref:Uncharacterized protein n=1 Tax=Trichothecium roseum TaxID=47278 RepID=A0ACC0USD2_9HYPO|nr:hypothetical protein N3K66_008586 [Trichothecium roseum]